MAPIIDASWRRSGSPEQPEQVSKRTVYEKTDEIFIKRRDTPSPTLATSSTGKATPTSTPPQTKARIQTSIVVDKVLAVDGAQQSVVPLSNVDSAYTSNSLPSDGSSSTAPPPNVGLIAGAVVGGVLALLLVFACIFFVNRRSRKHRDMQESTKPYPFTAQRPRDIENARVNTTMVSQPTAFRRGPSTAFAARFGAEADKAAGVKPRPPALPLKDPFVDPQPGAQTYENVSLSPEKPGRGVANPFADPGVSVNRSQSVGEPMTPGSRGNNRGGVGLGRTMQPGGAGVDRSASTRTLTNTPKPVVGLPSRPKSAAKSQF